MAWAKLATKTLTSSSNTIIPSTFTGNKFLFVISHHLGMSDATNNDAFNFNSDTASNYARRQSANGNSDTTSTSQTKAELYGWNYQDFAITYIVNISTEEKLLIHFKVNQGTAGAGTAPYRSENVAKWTNTSAQITDLSYNIVSGSPTFSSDSNLSILGTN